VVRAGISIITERGHDRLDRIGADTERRKVRHDALTQTVEIIAGMQRKHEIPIEQTIEAINDLARRAETS
jgi:hypothetical protein